MIDTMRDANGAGISANQIGIPYRLFVMEITENPRYPYKPKMLYRWSLIQKLLFKRC